MFNRILEDNGQIRIKIIPSKLTAFFNELSYMYDNHLPGFIMDEAGRVIASVSERNGSWSVCGKFSNVGMEM